MTEPETGLMRLAATTPAEVRKNPSREGGGAGRRCRRKSWGGLRGRTGEVIDRRRWGFWATRGGKAVLLLPQVAVADGEMGVLMAHSFPLFSSGAPLLGTSLSLLPLLFSLFDRLGRNRPGGSHPSASLPRYKLLLIPFCYPAPVEIPLR